MLPGLRFSRKWSVVFAAVMVVAAALVMLSFGAGTVSAQCPTCTPYYGCVDDFQDKSNCTAEDVQVASMSVLGYANNDSCAFVGDTAQVYLRTQLIAGANERYDISMYVALDGGSAQLPSRAPNGTSCYHDYLPPPLAPDGGNPTSGIGPFHNGESTTTTPPDTCGDIQQNVLTYYDLDLLTLPCVDANNDGQVDPISTCLGWDNQANQTPVCTGVNDAYPNTKAKCKCEPITVPELDIRKIIVDKVTIPGGYAQEFDFAITGPTPSQFSLADQDPAYYATSLAPGIYAVAETVPAGWTLSNNINETYCFYTGDEATKFAPSSIDLNVNREVQCRFTNRPDKGKIIVDKVVYPVGDTTSFDFALTGGPDTLNVPFSLADATTPFDSGLINPSLPGAKYSVTENTPVDWVLYSATCSDGSLPGAIDLAPGETVTCTFVNSLPTAIRLSSFTAAPAKNAIVVSWKTASETNNVGFNVYRSTSPNGKKTKLNRTMIATKVPPGSNKGAQYSFTDSSAKKRVTYYYWLEDVSLQGHTTMHGPVQAKR